LSQRTNMTANNAILVGQLWHEGHSFNPLLTKREDFWLSTGEALLTEARAAEMTLGGIVRRAEALGYRCIPSIAARARPGGPVDETVFLDVMDTMVAQARQGGFDGICIELHGATVAETSFDTEGVLLARLREAVGPEMPIVAGLDLHAYVTPLMVRSATLLTGYRTNPHADMAETGERAMMLLDRILRTGMRPRASLTRLPFLTRGNDTTAAGPLRPICDEADRWRTRDDLVDVSMFNVQPFLNVPDVGQTVLAYDQGNGAAPEAAIMLAKMLWQARSELEEQLPSIKAGLQAAASGDRLVALGDQGDRVTAGGPGESVEILIVAAELFPGLAVASGVFDPEAVAAAQEAGEGADIEFAIGARVTPGLRKLRRQWRVKRLQRARFVNRGPYMAGVEVDFGDAAVLVSEGVTAIVTSKAPNVHDPAFYEALGVPLATQKAVVARAALHYRLSFAGIAETITVDSPGMTTFHPAALPFTRARPFYPLDDVTWDAQEVSLR
jgi:microcystin degradation protein MlrC